MKSVAVPVLCACIIGSILGVGSAVVEKYGSGEKQNQNQNQNNNQLVDKKKLDALFERFRKSLILNDKEAAKKAKSELDEIGKGADLGNEEKEKLDKLITKDNGTNDKPIDKPVNPIDEAKQYVDSGDKLVKEGEQIVKNDEKSKFKQAVDLFRQAVEMFVKAEKVYQKNGGIPNWLSAKKRDAIQTMQICKRLAY